MSQTAYSEETQRSLEKEQPIATIIAKLPEYSRVVGENECSPSITYHQQSKKWEIVYKVQGEESPIVEFLERINNLNIEGINIDTTNKKILADNVSTVQELIEAYINKNPDHISPEDISALNDIYKDVKIKSDGEETSLLQNEQDLIHMVAQLPLNQMVMGRLSIGYKKTDDDKHKIIFKPEFGEAEEELKLFITRIETQKVEGISVNEMTITARDMESLERLMEDYIEHDPVQIGGEKIGEVTNSYLAYKSDALEEIKSALTEQNNGEPSVLDFEKYTPYPRTTYALYRGFETILAHYGSEINGFSNPENVYSIAWNITEDESNFFIFVEAVEGEEAEQLKYRSSELTGQLL